MFGSKQNARANLSKTGSVARRIALAGSMLPFLIGAAEADQALDAVVDALASRSERQAQLFNAGAMERWLELAGLGENFTLMQPFGGPTTPGFDSSPEHLATLAANFRNGDANIEMVQVVASHDVVMLAYVERQEIEVGGLPKQDWSLRVTQVFQRRGSDWKLVHRHADPLVRPVSLAEAAALAAGRDLAEAQAGGN